MTHSDTQNPLPHVYPVDGSTLKDIEWGLDALQDFVTDWTGHNFPENTSWRPTMGATEEIGELAEAILLLTTSAGRLSHAVLKADEKIRGTAEEHDAEARDAIGDIVIYLAHLCGNRGYSLSDIMCDVITELRSRDWILYPKNGKTE